MLTVPLVTPRKEQWKRLFDAARECARYGNHRLAERYLTGTQSVLVLTKERKEETKKRGEVERVILDPTAFVAARDKLSAVVRLGVDTMVQSAWQRQGRKVLAGVERLAQMDAYRALAAQVHQGGGSLTWDGKQFTLSMRVLPKDAGDTDELILYMPAVERDRYMRTTLDKIASGEWPLKRIALVFRRQSAKVKAQLSYVRPARVVEPGSQTAILRLQDDGTRLVLSCQGRELHLTDHLHRLRSKKEHFAGIHSRLRMSLGKARRWHDMRRALVRAGNFEEWSASPIHELSARIVDWARGQDAGCLEWSIGDGGDLPWHRLREQCRYKGAEVGLTLVERSGDDASASGETPANSDGAQRGKRGRSKTVRKSRAESGVSGPGVAVDAKDGGD